MEKRENLPPELAASLAGWIPKPEHIVADQLNQWGDSYLAICQARHPHTYNLVRCFRLGNGWAVSIDASDIKLSGIMREVHRVAKGQDFDLQRICADLYDNGV